MLERAWTLVVGLPDRGFRTAVLLLLCAMGYVQYATWREVRRVAGDRALEARIVALEREHAVDHVRLEALERQVQKLWERRR